MVDFDEIADGVPQPVVLRDALGRETKARDVLFPHANAGGGTLLLPATVPTNVSALQLGWAGRFRVVRQRP